LLYLCKSFQIFFSIKEFLIIKKRVENRLDNTLATFLVRKRCQYLPEREL